MTDFTWRVMAPETLKAYSTAVRDFETVTSLSVDRADTVSLARWQASMEARGLAVNTIRQRLSAVCMISGVAYSLPARKTIESQCLTIDQVRAILMIVTDQQDRLLLVRLLTIGSMARRVQVDFQETFRAHFLGGQIELSAKAVSRKLQRYARKAGISAEINMRTWCKSGRNLMRAQGINDLVTLLTQTGSQPESKPLHGINRRSHLVQA